MTDNKVLWIRILITIATFVALTGTIISYWHKRFGPEYLYPGPIYTFLCIIAFFTLANGVSYFSEIIKKDKNYLKFFAGILSGIIFIFTFFPQNQDASPFIMWIIFIGLSCSSILISLFSVLERVTHTKRFKWFFIFLFALNSGIYSCLVFAMILRGYNFSEGGILLIGYGAVIFLVSMIVNLITVSSLKKVGANQ